MADETGHRRQWQPDRCYPVESYQISIWVAVAEVRYPPALFGAWSSSLLFTPIVIFDYLNVGTGIPWASHNKASLNDDFIRMISDLLRGGRRGGTLVIGSSKHDDGNFFFKFSLKSNQWYHPLLECLDRAYVKTKTVHGFVLRLYQFHSPQYWGFTFTWRSVLDSPGLGRVEWHESSFHDIRHSTIWRRSSISDEHFPQVLFKQ